MALRMSWWATSTSSPRGRRRRRRVDNLSAVCSRIAYSDQKRPWCSYLLPAGEGAPQGRMRVELLALARKSPHPAVPATFSPREKERRPRRACNSTVKRANALTGPRAYFAMARDGLLPRSLCRVHPRSPANAVLAQGLWATLLTVAGTALIVVPPPSVSVGAPGFLLAPILDAWTKLNQTPLYDLLLTYVIFGANLFYLLAITSVFVLRIKQPDLPRPYRTWGYPYTPLLYVAAAVLLLGNMLVDLQSRVQALAGSGLILLGIPAWAILRRRRPRT